MNAVQINKLYKEIAGSDADITDLDVDIDDLLKKIEQDKNAYLENTTLADIHADILTALNSLDGIKPSALKGIYARLTHYRFVDELNEIHLGKYVRWIRKESQNEYGTYYLTLGGFVVDIIFTDEGTIILIKTADDKFFKFPFDECLAFQKLTYDEQLILSLYDVLNATN
jgi:hypothetical protein